MRKQKKMGEKINDAVELVVTHLKQPFLFSKDAVEKTTFSLLEEHKKAVRLILNGFTLTSKTKANFQDCFHGFFGNLDNQHGIYPKNKLGFSATEPQITKGIVHFINPDNYGKTGVLRLKTFLHALLYKQSKYDVLIKSLEDAHSFTVEAEKSVKNGKRIDIFVGWNPQGKDKYKYGLIIEAKFGHKVTIGQLSSYREYAKKLINNDNDNDNDNDIALILLTLNGKPSNRNKEWHPVQWFTLMSRWERKLCKLNNCDTDFNNFRRFVWNKI
jgi:hypothetical protein